MYHPWNDASSYFLRSNESQKNEKQLRIQREISWFCASSLSWLEFYLVEVAWLYFIMFRQKLLCVSTVLVETSEKMDVLKIEDFKSEMLLPFLWSNITKGLILTVFLAFFVVGFTSKVAIINFIQNYAPTRPINQNILVEQVNKNQQKNRKRIV